MKNILKTFAILFLFANNSCKAQQMVQTTKDVCLLKTNEQQFINKPLEDLLKAIKPEIKTADATNDNPLRCMINLIPRATSVASCK
jgi:hypothetical protein